MSITRIHCLKIEISGIIWYHTFIWKEDICTSKDKVSKEFNFLIKAKKLVNNKDGFTIVNRDKNLNFITNNGLLIEDIKNIIGELKCSDYIKGPELDHSGSGTVWIFKKEYDSKLIYIKLKIENQNNVEILKCISLHEDEK